MHRQEPFPHLALLLAALRGVSMRQARQLLLHRRDVQPGSAHAHAFETYIIKVVSCTIVETTQHITLGTFLGSATWTGTLTHVAKHCNMEWHPHIGCRQLRQCQATLKWQGLGYVQWALPGSGRGAWR